MKRLITLTFFTIITFGLLVSTYAIFENTIEKGTEIHIANWNVEINNTFVGNELREFTIDDIIWELNDNVESGKIAPGGRGYFDIMIDPKLTDVAVRYNLKYDLTSLNELNPSIIISSISELNGHSLIYSDLNTYTGIFSLDDINDNVKHTIRIYISWLDIPNNNDNDYLTAQNFEYLNIPIEVNFSQYLGETIINYSEE